MKNPLCILLCLVAGWVAGCQHRAPPAPPEELAGPMQLKVLKPGEARPLVIVPQAFAPVDAAWQSLAVAGGQLDFGSSPLDFSPRSAQWRFTLTTERTPAATDKPNQDHSHVKISLWIGDKDAAGKVVLRPVKVDFKRKGGAGCVQEFDNGLWPDGTPRPIHIVISGTDIVYSAKVEDLGLTAIKPLAD